MDRGFTVEGLTITYMPRDIGVAHADTVQQRARFFGYKREYLNFCRVYLENNAKDAYKSYVSHEEDIRNRLIRFQHENKPLSDWKRAFFLTEQLKPTRNNVLDLDYMRGSFSNDWYAPKRPHDSNDAVASNRILVNEFIKNLKLQPDEGHKDRTKFQQHSKDGTLTLGTVYEQLLVKLRITDPIDSRRFTGLLLQVGKFFEGNHDDPCAVYLISHSKDQWREREFTVDENDEIPNFFQGEYPVEPKEKRGSIYPGDREIRLFDNLTVQIRRVNVKDKQGKRIADDVPVVTIWIPNKMSGDWLIQDQGK
jgi:hypothetical protein